MLCRSEGDKSTGAAVTVATTAAERSVFIAGDQSLESDGFDAREAIFTAYAMLNGRDRNRLPVAAKIALPTAGAIPGVPISPTPPRAAPEFAISTMISGASSRVRIG